MTKEFKQLRGNRIYLELPEEPVSNIHLDEESKKLLEAEKLKKWGRLKVYAVGTAVNSGTDEEFHIKEGDEIMIDPSSVAKVIKIPISDIKTVLQISSFDVNHIW
jgi:hypothetical protein